VQSEICLVRFLPLISQYFDNEIVNDVLTAEKLKDPFGFDEANF
jgi:hypothetical protein